MLTRINFRKAVLKILNSLQPICGILLQMHYETKLFQVYSLQYIQTQKFKTLRGYFNTFQQADKSFSFSYSLI